MYCMCGKIMPLPGDPGREPAPTLNNKQTSKLTSSQAYAQDNHTTNARTHTPQILQCAHQGYQVVHTQLAGCGSHTEKDTH